MYMMRYIQMVWIDRFLITLIRLLIFRKLSATDTSFSHFHIILISYSLITNKQNVIGNYKGQKS